MNLGSLGQGISRAGSQGMDPKSHGVPDDGRSELAGADLGEGCYTSAYWGSTPFNGTSEMSPFTPTGARGTPTGPPVIAASNASRLEALDPRSYRRLWATQVRLLQMSAKASKASHKTSAKNGCGNLWHDGTDDTGRSRKLEWKRGQAKTGSKGILHSIAGYPGMGT